MATRLDCQTLAVDAASNNVYYTNVTSAPFTVKNIGLVTVYMRQVSDGLVNTSAAFPILPGETIYNVPNGDGGSNNAGFNTLAGVSKVALIGTVTV